jgi:hypothetical protein
MEGDSNGFLLGCTQGKRTAKRPLSRFFGKNNKKKRKTPRGQAIRHQGSLQHA